ncbi:MAG: hypothetical protein ACYTFY_22345 [Planctomycetota bacterium]|jgi:glycine/serine hydroxymethyltransferase
MNNETNWQTCTEWLNEALEKHIDYRHKSLNLIASENVMSHDVAQFYNLELGHRYGNYTGLDLDQRTYRGNKYFIDIEKRALKDACELFHAEAADLRSLSLKLRTLDHFQGMWQVLQLSLACAIRVILFLRLVKTAVGTGCLKNYVKPGCWISI